jgi:hypothetical protein
MPHLSDLSLEEAFLLSWAGVCGASGPEHSRDGRDSGQSAHPEVLMAS